MLDIDKIDSVEVDLNSDQRTLVKAAVLADFGYVPVMDGNVEDTYEAEAGILDELIKYLGAVEKKEDVPKGIQILKYKGASLAISRSSALTSLSAIEQTLEARYTLCERVVALSH